MGPVPYAAEGAVPLRLRRPPRRRRDGRARSQRGAGNPERLGPPAGVTFGRGVRRRDRGRRPQRPRGGHVSRARSTPGARARETRRGWRPCNDGGDCSRFPRAHRGVCVRPPTSGSRRGSEPGRARGPIHPAGPRRRCAGRWPGPPHLEGCPEDREGPRFGLGEGRADVSAIHRIPEPIRRGAGSDPRQDRKSTRLNSSHMSISYAVFCLKKKKKKKRTHNDKTKKKKTKKEK